MSYDGFIAFAAKWTKVYQAEIEAKISEDYAGKERAIRLSPKSHYKTISSVETGSFFAVIGKIAANTDNGEISSASLVLAHLEEMQKDQLKDIDLTSDERKTIKQRIQSQHMTLMSALAHFGLFEIKVRKGPTNNDVNFYAITEKGRKTLPKLE